MIFDKVIFLDIDGVMNSVATPFGAGRGLASFLDPNNVAVLNHIVRATGAVIVVTSTWRLTMSIEQLRAHFAEAGCVAEIVDTTPDVDAYRRDREIRAWLAAQREPPRRFVILDDDREMCDLAGRLIRTDQMTGLSAREQPQVLALLADASGV
jgi:hypothetical protein